MSLENEWKNTCRLCGEMKSDMLKIYGDEGKKRKIGEKLRVCIPVLVYKTDPLPKNICQFCAARLDDIYEFREYCLTVYKKMYIKLKNNKNDKTVSIYLNALDNSSDKSEIKSRAPLPTLLPLPISSANNNYNIINNNNNNNSQGCNGDSERLSEASLNKSTKPNVTDDEDEERESSSNELEDDKRAFKELAGLPCEVEIKEEPIERHHVDDMLLLDDDDEDDDNHFNHQNQDDHSELKDISNNYNGDSEDLNNYDDDKSESDKRTSILEQALTGILSANEAKELPVKTKLTSQWWCSPCNSYFKTKEALMKHMQVSCPRSYTCGKCSRVFKSVEELAKHEGTDHLKVTLDFDETMKECHQCDREFVSWEMLRHHRMRDHVGRSLELGTSTWCQICNRFFPNVELYKSHLELHVDEDEHQMIEATLGEELLDEEPVYDDAEDRKKEHFIKSIKSLTCPTCGKVCTQQSALSNHMRTHEPKKHKCDECGRSFGLLIRLETHRLSEHNHQEAGLTSVEQEEALNAEREAREARMKNTRCRQFSETLDTDELLTDNLPAPKKIASNGNSLKNVARCGICQQWFTDHTTMLTHLQTHSDNFVVKNFSCNICKKSFKEKWQLQRHETSHKRKKGLGGNVKDIYEKTHVVDKTYHCAKCNKIFFKESSLMTHQCSPIMSAQKNSGMDKIKSIDDSMKFKCSKCGACFNSSKSRNSHMKIHAGSKAKKEVQNVPKLLPDISPGISVLLEPKVEIQEELPPPPPPVKRTLIKTANGYRCGVCQSPFVLRELAVAHLRSAHPVMPYQCPYCKKRFTTQYTFSHHIKEEHPDDSEK